MLKDSISRSWVSWKLENNTRHFRNKKRECQKTEINELETDSKNRNIRDLYRGISDFNKGHQPKSNLVKHEKGDLIADSHNILARWRNDFSQLLIVHGLMMLGIPKYSRTTSAWAQCLWGWDGNWNTKKTQVTRYWFNYSRID